MCVQWKFSSSRPCVVVSVGVTRRGLELSHLPLQTKQRRLQLGDLGKKFWCYCACKTPGNAFLEHLVRKIPHWIKWLLKFQILRCRVNQDINDSFSRQKGEMSPMSQSPCFALTNKSKNIFQEKQHS